MTAQGKRINNTESKDNSRVSFEEHAGMTGSDSWKINVQAFEFLCESKNERILQGNKED